MNDVLERALEIDKSIKPAIPKTILTTVYLDDLPKGFTFENGKSNITKRFEVLEYNPFKMKDCFLIELPNGKQVWRELYNYYTESKEEIVPISPIEELLEDRPEEAQV